MTTITIPRTEYVQRADDEGRDFHPLRTMRAAAIEWAAQDGNGYTEHGDEREEAPVLILVTNGASTPEVWTIREDPEMGLYPADGLPFTIKPADDVTVGDWVAVKIPSDRVGHQVTAMRDDGTWVIDINGSRGVIPPRDQHTWVKVLAPTVTYTVTLSASHDQADVLDALSSVLPGRITVEKVNP